MFKKILVANRGEIAVRVIRACRELGIETVAVYSTADKDALHTQLADEAICIGQPKVSDSYLNMNNIISAAVHTGCEAIHPGFGFLSENARFARLCEDCSIKFIGPSAEIIEKMGDKANAREMMILAGVPVVPGTEGLVDNVDQALAIGETIGYPVIVKASAGGGGRGMRVAWSKDELEQAFTTAKMEAKACFGNDDVYVEKFIENPRHIEIQILGDEHGNVIHLGERDCSIQRRNQKVVEEAPSPFLKEELRQQMGEAAVKGAKSVGYANAGTIEFLVDRHGKFYFMEMNTRIQVEHPVTEMVTGVDIVKEQIRLAWGEELGYVQSDIKITGHAIECRINAEDPTKNFAPSPGKIEFIHMPGGPGIRNESAVYNKYVIPPHYDSMIGKLIVTGKNREEAIGRMRRALGEYVIQGIKSNLDFQFEIISNEDFKKGQYDTGFIKEKFGL